MASSSSTSGLGSGSGSGSGSALTERRGIPGAQFVEDVQTYLTESGLDVGSALAFLQERFSSLFFSFTFSFSTFSKPEILRICLLFSSGCLDSKNQLLLFVSRILGLHQCGNHLQV